MRPHQKINSGLTLIPYVIIKNTGGFGCINIKDFFTGLKLSWIRRYSINKINDHWCDIIDIECGIQNMDDRIKILGWGSELLTNPIKKPTQVYPHGTKTIK